MATEGKARDSITRAIVQGVCGGLYGLVLGLVSAHSYNVGLFAQFGIVVAWILGTLGALMVFVAMRGSLPNKGWFMGLTALALVTFAVITGLSMLFAVVGPLIMIVAVWTDGWFARNRVTVTR